MEINDALFRICGTMRCFKRLIGVGKTAFNSRFSQFVRFRTLPPWPKRFGYGIEYDRFI